MKNGFTLVELIIVFLILGLVSMIAIPSFKKIRAKVLEKKASEIVKVEVEVEAPTNKVIDAIPQPPDPLKPIFVNDYMLSVPRRSGGERVATIYQIGETKIVIIDGPGDKFAVTRLE